MNTRNLVAKHMNTYNRSSVVQDKRDKYLDDIHEQEMEQEEEDNDSDE